MKHVRIIYLFTVLILSSCTGTEQVVQSSDTSEDLASSGSDVDVDGSIDIENMSELEQTLYNNRSALGDLFASLSHDMPEAYLTEIENNEEVDIYSGFRVQILSTRDVVLADSTRIQFTTWADSTFTQYIPRAEIHYRQPFYRVRIGDFHDQSRAVELSRKIKFKFPEAWVVHDQVNPAFVPADTVSIELN